MEYLNQQQGQTLEDLVGRRIAFGFHPSDEQYTGTIQQVLVLNGNSTILLKSEHAFHIFALSSIYGIRFVDVDERAADVSNATPIIQINDDSDDSDSGGDDETQAPDEEEEVDEFSSVPFIAVRSQEQAQQEQQAQDESHQCAICLDSIDMKQNAASTECGHQFHFSCLMKNMASVSSNRQRCPLCRDMMMEGYTVCNDQETVRRMIEAITQSNRGLQIELEASERLEDSLNLQLQEIATLRSRLAERRMRTHQAALAILDQDALASNMYGRISNLVASAADNDIRENYADIHEFFEQEIRSICFGFAMRALFAAPPEVLVVPDEVFNEAGMEPPGARREFPVLIG
jgi:hypothetical protein